MQLLLATSFTCVSLQTQEKHTIHKPHSTLLSLQTRIQCILINNLISFGITTQDHKSILSIISTTAPTASTVSYYCEIVGKCDLSQEGAAIRSSKFQYCSGPNHFASCPRSTWYLSHYSTVQSQLPCSTGSCSTNQAQEVHILWIYRSMQK